jgi:DNA-binding protein HU-beta
MHFLTNGADFCGAQLDILEWRALFYAPLSQWREGADMTKAQLVSKLAEDTKIPRKQVDQVIEELVGTVIKTVKKGENLKIPGLGIFRLRKMKARMGRNPQTGEAIKIPARKKVGFTVAKSFKESVLGIAKKK